MRIEEALLTLKNNSFSDKQFVSFVLDSLECLKKKDIRTFVDAVFTEKNEAKYKMCPYVLNLIIRDYPLSFEDREGRHLLRGYKYDKWCEPQKTKSYCCSIFSTYGQFVFSCKLSRYNVCRWTISPRSTIYNFGINIVDANRFISLDKIVVLDLETTSLNPLTGDVIEIAFFEPSTNREYSRLLPLNRSKRIPDEIISLTGISNEMIQNVPAIASEELDKIIDDFNLSNKTILIWSGINMFDAHFLATLFIQTGNKRFKELKFVSAMEIIKQDSNYSFASLSKDYIAGRLNIDICGSHRALNDCKIEADIYKRLFENRN